ncbi:hypothetical protein DFR49_3036 [Hephaestia caeni]|uniref:Cupin type-2 domain-containing protein n=1 Tax=Hephaestia caeni TaxID=645617 RepID=A0A397NNH0_9SPHN|nr:cupin domain-containing protein [Hephaestia caeni]RIA37159.1 hypothetical protein DFR49_3036 [Hephaestia caeni]
MKTIDISPEEMNKRVARYADLVPYGNQHTGTINPEVFEHLTARRVLSIMAPHNYTGRSAQAPIKSLPGAVISIAETPPGNAPALHAHDTAIENFFVINGRYKISWGDEGQHSLELGPMDFISIPPRVNRTFLNITDETARLLAIIQPLGEDQEDRVAFATSVAPKISDQYGEETLAALREIGFHFDAGQDSEA